MQIAPVVGHELLNAGRGDLGDEIADFLIVPPRAQWAKQIPVIAFLLQLHFAGGRFHDQPSDLGGIQICEFFIAKIVRFFIDGFPDRLRDEAGLFGVLEAHIHPVLEGGILAEENFRRRFRPDQLQAQLGFVQAVFGQPIFVRLHFLWGNGGLFLPALHFGESRIDQAGVGLVLDRAFQAPFFVVAAQLDFVVAILNDHALDLIRGNVDHVLGLPLGLLGAGQFLLIEIHVAEEKSGEDQENQSCLRLHE